MGLVNFYHRFVKNCADIIKPLNDLSTTVKDDSQKLQWNSQAATAFTNIKQTLASATLLFHPKQEAPPPSIDCTEIAAAQKEDPGLKQLTDSTSSLSLTSVPVSTADITMICNVYPLEPPSLHTSQVPMSHL